MGWAYKGKWPIQSGEEITFAHFEDLRKLMWSIDWIILPENYWEEGYEDYYPGDVVFYGGQEWKLVNPSYNKNNKPSASNPDWEDYPRFWRRNFTYHQFDRVFFSSSQGLPQWKVGNYYYTEMVVKWLHPGGSGEIYRKCIVPHTSDSYPNNFFNSTLWETVQPPYYEYMMTFVESTNTPPPRNGWKRIPRRNVYSDWNRNSGCWHLDWKWNADERAATVQMYWPSYLRYPPQLNKFSQGFKVDATGFVIPNEQIYGRLRSKEMPVEFGLTVNDYNGESALITGPFGARYVEHHPPDETWIIPPPWYEPYHITNPPGIPYAGNKYYDKKMQGYQSFVEWFVEHYGGRFYWPLEGQALKDAIDEGKATYCPLKDNEAMTIWNCNRSAFEKCLEIVEGEQSGCHYDWYLDLLYAPDPVMRRLINPPQQLKGVWRRCWRHTFGPPLGLLWPGEKASPTNPGTIGPPYIEELGVTDFWKSEVNCQKAYNTALTALTAEDVQGLLKRHYPKEIKRNPDTYPEEGQEQDPYWDEVDRLLETYKTLQALIEYILAHGGSIVSQWQEFIDFYQDLMFKSTGEHQPELYYEIHHDMANDMKWVLECLQWLYEPCSQDGTAWWDRPDSTPPIPDSCRATWEAAKSLANSWCQEQEGGGNKLGDYGTGTYDWHSQYGGRSAGYYFAIGTNIYKNKKIQRDISGNNIAKFLDHAFFDRVMLCLDLRGEYGICQTPDYYLNTYWWQWLTVYGIKRSFKIHSGDTEPHYVYIDFPASQVDYQTIRMNIYANRSFPNSWGSPIPDNPTIPNESEMRGRINVGFKPNILIGIDPYKVDLNSNLIE